MRPHLRNGSIVVFCTFLFAALAASHAGQGRGAPAGLGRTAAASRAPVSPDVAPRTTERVADLGVYSSEIFPDPIAPGRLAPLSFTDVLAEDPTFTLVGGEGGDTVSVSASGTTYVLFMGSVGARSTSVDADPRAVRIGLDRNGGDLLGESFGYIVNDDVENTRRTFPATAGIALLEDGDLLQLQAEVTSATSSDVLRFGHHLQLLVLDRTWSYFRATLGSDRALTPPPGLQAGALETVDWQGLEEVDGLSFEYDAGAIRLRRPGHYLLVADARFRVDSTADDRRATVSFEVHHPDLPTGSREAACSLVPPAAGTMNTLLVTLVDVQDTASDLLLRTSVVAREDEDTTVTMLSPSSVAIVRLPNRADYFSGWLDETQQGATTVGLRLGAQTEVATTSFAHDTEVLADTIFLRREAKYLFLGGGLIDRAGAGNDLAIYGHWQWENELDEPIEPGNFGQLNVGNVDGVDYGYAGSGGLLLVPGGYRDKGVRLFFVNQSFNFDIDCKHRPGNAWVDALNLRTLGRLDADFETDVVTGDHPLTVQFVDRSSGPVESWSWDFGDTGASAEINPSHTYTEPGVYEVALAVDGPDGQSEERRPGFVTVTPIAEFDASKTSGDRPLAVDFVDLSVGDVTSWSWDFGDGAVSDEQNPTHVYTSAGTYTVTLVARTALASDTETKEDLVAVSDPSPVADFVGAPLSGDAPLLVSFSDLSGGTVTAWSWDFGDGELSSEQNPSHLFAAPGAYTVTLTATGPSGVDVASKPDYVIAGPYASFDADPTVGAAPLEVSFTDLSVGTVTAWTWDFGDLSGDTVQDPVHTYATPGLYTVTLVVDGPGGSTRAIRTGFIEVLEPPPCAKFSASPLVGSAPLLVDFTDASLGAVSGWSWDFGDGSTSEEEHPAHVYARAGNYTVSLEVSGPGGTDRVVKTNLIQVF